MPEIDIKRGFEVLPDNNIRFCIRISNNTEFIIVDVEVILDYSGSLFELDGNILLNLATINSNLSRNAEFILKPLGCIHKNEIGATIRYKDHTGKRYTIEMYPKEVHCVYPFLMGKQMAKSEFFELLNTGQSVEMGLDFRGVSVKQLTSFFDHTYKNRHYKVEDISINGGRILFYASNSIGEKAYYLLTALIKEEKETIRVMLKAVSDKPQGLNGFLNETIADLRHVISTVQSANEIGIIKKEQVINIIDSVVQRTSFSFGEEVSSVNIDGSVMQRTEFTLDKDETQLEEVEKRYKERKAKENNEIKVQKEGENKKYQLQVWDGNSNKKFVFVTLLLGMLIVSYWLITLENNDSALPLLNSTINQTHEKTTIVALTNLTASAEKSTAKVNSTISISNEDNQEILETSSTVTSKIPEYYNNSIGIEFLLIPAGEFDMGSKYWSWSDSIYTQEEPIHQVNIEKAFYLGKYEVTQKQWHEVMGNDPSYFKGDDLPVEQVSWNEVREFIRVLNGKENSDKYRLPSEAEWEYAARAGTSTDYYFGDSVSELGDYAWYQLNSEVRTHPIGQKMPNSWGLYDIYGNVWELIQDDWHSNHVGAPTDGSAWASGGSLRGGSWNSDYTNCRSATRGGYIYGLDTNRFQGFRLVKEI